MTPRGRCAAEAPERFAISPGRTCGFAAKIYRIWPTLTRRFTEFRIDREEDRTLRAVLRRMLRRARRFVSVAGSIGSRRRIANGRSTR
jgi:hypothetical protein